MGLSSPSSALFFSEITPRMGGLFRAGHGAPGVRKFAQTRRFRAKTTPRVPPESGNLYQDICRQMSYPHIHAKLYAIGGGSIKKWRVTTT